MGPFGPRGGRGGPFGGHGFGLPAEKPKNLKASLRRLAGYLEGATEEQVHRAAAAAHADHFIRTLPEGYDTVLNEDASNISQGQKQLLTIARAVLADPAILILDEATSSVDTRTEVLIQKAMKALRKGRTSFVIAHRLSTIRNADKIIALEDGCIKEVGSHEELLSRDGLYSQLYHRQLKLGSGE